MKPFTVASKNRTRSNVRPIKLHSMVVAREPPIMQSATTTKHGVIECHHLRGLTLRDRHEGNALAHAPSGNGWCTNHLSKGCALRCCVAVVANSSDVCFVIFSFQLRTLLLINEGLLWNTTTHEMVTEAMQSLMHPQGWTQRQCNRSCTLRDGHRGNTIPHAPSGNVWCTNHLSMGSFHV